MNHRPLVFIDVETTGVNPNTSRVIDVGAIRVENEKIVRSMNQLINPEKIIPNYITNLTGITNEMICASPSFSAIAEELEELLEGAIFIAHHVSFDYSFIKTEFARNGVSYSSDRACTVRLSRKLRSNHRRHNLDSIIASMGIEVKNRHRGYDDAEVLWKLFQCAVQKDRYRAYRDLSSVTISAAIKGGRLVDSNNVRAQQQLFT